MNMFKFTFTPKQKLNMLHLLYAVLILVVFFSYRCPFLLFWGIPCPGCGMTRAFIALLHLDIQAAFYYHPLFPLVILLLLWGLFSVWKANHPALYTRIFARLPFAKPLRSFASNKTMRRLFLVLTCALFFLVFFIRLFSGSDVVRPDFQNALVWRLLSQLLSPDV